MAPLPGMPPHPARGIMGKSVIILGAGMVGTSTALHLSRRGFDVFLVDRDTTCRQTSFGNAGLIQREACEPYRFPLNLGELARIAFGRSPAARYDITALPALWRPLLRYASMSTASRYPDVCVAFSALIQHCLTEHAPLVAESHSSDLVRHGGWRCLLHGNTRAVARDIADAHRMAQQYGLTMNVETPEMVRNAEPALRKDVPGAIVWGDPWFVTHPGTLVDRYAALFDPEGTRRLVGDARTLTRSGAGWSVRTTHGNIEAEQVVIALGPWSGDLLRNLKFRFPLFVKRGYHKWYRCTRPPTMPLLHQAAGTMILPGDGSVRITTGAEFARRDAPPDSRQLEAAWRGVNDLIGLEEPLDEGFWMGSRPCMPDMLPVVGQAPGEKGMWLNFGHAHQGFTLGPVTGRLLAEMMNDEKPFIDPAPYRAERWM
ncbi:NAD(P)/FAD-dependent oxidoreductase [Gluconacetobacter sp. Hr-1-5]|uniref:NAD(P)/FAD-dependent oxidoreductase n=1 Tax=Gluconacetobacter sp. Hr-1-5 TaxID=3395370 RepID=UPI003B51C9D1